MQFLQAMGTTAVDPQEVVLDLDGSGPLPPVSVVCEMSTEGEYVTSIKHSNEKDTKVDGFQARGSFHQVIHYHAHERVMKHLLSISGKCWQSLSYKCKQSRLFDSPVATVSLLHTRGGFRGRIRRWTTCQGHPLGHGSVLVD